MIKLLRYIFVALLPSSSMAMNLLGQKTEVGKNSSVVVLYSGGLDSSAVAALLAAKGIKNIHLITCDNGAQDHLKYAEFKLDDFRQKFPETNFIHTYQESRYPFKKFALIDIESDIKKYTTNLVCVGCKLAMHGVAIVYALKHTITQVADGFAKRQADFPEQDPSFIEEMKKIYAHYGLQYENPLYDIGSSKEAVKDILSRYGLSTKSVEPGCLFGSTFSKPSSENVRSYCGEKASKVLEYVDARLKESV